jgi:hypothetical protein
MGILEVNQEKLQIYIYSNIILNGNAIGEEIRRNMEEEINDMWNQPRGLVWMNQLPYLVNFVTHVFLFPDLKPYDIVANTNPRNNYFRIEDFAFGNISYVDGLGSNTGYFLLDNLYKGSTTAAHEYGHTLGLPHPDDLDIRGKGIPGIMFPRGTLVDAEYQYDPLVAAGEKGGTIYPIHRRVLQSDIDDLNLAGLLKSNKMVIGSFSSKYHEAQEKI